jgi:hypothetical protein
VAAEHRIDPPGRESSGAMGDTAPGRNGSHTGKGTETEVISLQSSARVRAAFWLTADD